MFKPQNLLTRRRFLKGAGAAALAAFLSACGNATDGEPPSPSPVQTQRPVLSSRTPTSSPTATSSTTPTASPTPSATPDAFGSPLDSPLDSPLPTDTEPPPPTATPTPLPTPFPAGPPTKLGLFVAWFHPQIMDLVKTGNVTVLKTLEFDPEFLADVKARSPDTIIVGRVQLGQVGLSSGDMAAEARRAADAVLSLALGGRGAGLVDAWEGFNEPVAGDAGEMGKLAELEVERVRLLAERGVRAVVGNFGTGQPPLEWWPAFRPALEAARRHDGYLGLHEYSAPTIWFNTNRSELDFGANPSDEGWLTLRYRKVYREYLHRWGLRLPLILTECGVDGLVTDRPGPPGNGWKDFAGYWAELGMGPDAPGNYVEQLAWYDSQLQLDDYVVGGTVFAMTAFQEWESYQLLGDAATILQQYLSVHPLR
jgi:hypothetical protein